MSAVTECTGLVEQVQELLDQFNLRSGYWSGNFSVRDIVRIRFRGKGFGVHKFILLPEKTVLFYCILFLSCFPVLFGVQEEGC